MGFQPMQAALSLNYRINQPVLLPLAIKPAAIRLSWHDFIGLGSGLHGLEAHVTGKSFILATAC
jgi:hypothetical protein